MLKASSWLVLLKARPISTNSFGDLRGCTREELITRNLEGILNFYVAAILFCLSERQPSVSFGLQPRLSSTAVPPL